MSTLQVNTNGISELDLVFPGTTTASVTSPGTTTIVTVGFNGVNAQTTSYTIASSDNEKLVTFDNASGVTATLPQPGTSGIDSKFVTWIADIGVGLLTITPTSATIDGASSLSISQNQGVIVFTDGTNYFTVRGAVSGSGLTLETDGTLNGSQSLLNLQAGTNVTLTDNGSGTITVDATGMTNPMTTVGDLIVGGTVTGGVAAPARLGAGTSGNVLTSNGPSAAPSWQPSGGAGGSFVLLEQHTASGSTELDFTTCISSTYDTYEIVLVQVVPATNGANLTLQFSTNGGVSWDTTIGNYAWTNWAWVTGGAGQGGSNSDSNIQIGSSIENGSPWSMSGSLRLYNPLGGSLYPQIHGQLHCLQTTNFIGGFLAEGISYSGTYLQTAAANAFRIIASSGNIASGTIRVYGLTH